jgi:ornithine--oxo-acid transaminase
MRKYARSETRYFNSREAISGGVYPVSAVLANNHIMNVIQPGQHGSTFGNQLQRKAVAITCREYLKHGNSLEIQ